MKDESLGVEEELEVEIYLEYLRGIPKKIINWKALGYDEIHDFEFMRFVQKLFNFL